MRLVETEEMKKMREKFKPYLISDKDGRHVAEDAPEGVEEAYEEYKRLWNEMMDYAMSL